MCVYMCVCVCIEDPLIGATRRFLKSEELEKAAGADKVWAVQRAGLPLPVKESFDSKHDSGTIFPIFPRDFLEFSLGTQKDSQKWP